MPPISCLSCVRRWSVKNVARCDSFILQWPKIKGWAGFPIISHARYGWCLIIRYKLRLRVALGLRYADIDLTAVFALSDVGLRDIRRHCKALYLLHGTAVLSVKQLKSSDFSGDKEVIQSDDFSVTLYNFFIPVFSHWTSWRKSDKVSGVRKNYSLTGWVKYV